MTPADIDAEIARVASWIEGKGNDMHAWFFAKRDYFKSRLEFEDAKARVNAEGPVSERKYKAILSTQKERLEADIAEAEYRLVAGKVQARRDLLMALMARNKNIMQAYNGGGRHG